MLHARIFQNCHRCQSNHPSTQNHPIISRLHSISPHPHHPSIWLSVCRRRSSWLDGMDDVTCMDHHNPPVSYHPHSLSHLRASSRSRSTKFTTTAAKSATASTVGPKRSSKPDWRRSRIARARQWKVPTAYSIAAIATTVNSAALVCPTRSPKLSSPTASPPRMTEKLSHDRNVRSLAKKTLGSTRVGSAMRLPVPVREGRFACQRQDRPYPARTAEAVGSTWYRQCAIDIKVSD